MTRAQAFLRASLIIALVTVVGACGGSETSRERPLTADEAAVLAGVQYDNLLKEGAVFEIAAADTTANTSLSLTGEIDWENHRGRATVNASGQESGVVAVTWEKTRVLEQRRDVAALLGNLGYAPGTWIGRQPDVSNRALDRVVAIVTGLAAKQPDNAILIQQKAGSAFVRDDTWKNTPVKVYRYGERTLFWLDATTNELRRFEGNNARGTRPVIIDFLERTPRSIELPDEGEIVPVSAIQEMHAASTTP